jgi:hypothetical protein
MQLRQRRRKQIFPATKTATAKTADSNEIIERPAIVFRGEECRATGSKKRSAL